MKPNSFYNPLGVSPTIRSHRSGLLSADGPTGRCPKVPTRSRLTARRADPERIFQARRDAIRNRLIGTGLEEARADAWIAAWEAQAALDGLPRDGVYWETGWRWVTQQREQRARP